MTTAPSEAGVAAEPAVDDLATDFVAAVCRPGDVPAVLDTLARVDPVDLAGLVAAVDDHQPMTLEVVVDVLAELGVSPTLIASAVGVDADDVHVLLGPPLPDHRPSRGATASRVIDVSHERRDEVGPASGEDPDTEREAVRVVTAGPDLRVDVAVADDDDHRPDAADFLLGADGAEAESGIQHVAEGPDAESVGGSVDGVGESATPVVRIGTDDPAQDVDEAIDRSAATPVTDPSSRARVWFAVVLFVLLVGGAVALAWLVGAFQPG